MGLINGVINGETNGVINVEMALITELVNLVNYFHADPKDTLCR